MPRILPSVLLVASLVAFNNVFPQEHLLVYGIVKDIETGRSLQNVRVRLYTDSLQGDSVFTGPLGRYQIKLPMEGMHIVEYNIPHYHDKLVQLSTDNDMDSLDLEQEWGMRIDINLVSDSLDIPAELLSMPAGKAEWISPRHAFEWDGPYRERYLFQFRKAVKAAKRG